MRLVVFETARHFYLYETLYTQKQGLYLVESCSQNQYKHTKKSPQTQVFIALLLKKINTFFRLVKNFLTIPSAGKQK